MELSKLEAEIQPLPHVHYTVFCDVHAKSKTEHTTEWKHFADEIKNPKEYESKEACPLLSFVKYGNEKSAGGALRHSKNVKEITGLVCDYDGKPDGNGKKLTVKTASDALAIWGYQAVIHTTARHTAETPRFRIILPASRPISARGHNELMTGVNELLGGLLAQESFMPTQSYHFGRVKGKPYESVVLHGSPVDTVFNPSAFASAVSSPSPIAANDDVSITLPALTDEQLRHVESALDHLASMGHGNSYPDWQGVGQALKAAARNEAGQRGPELFALWHRYSERCENYEGPESVLKKWRQLSGEATGMGSIFKKAQALGWVNPKTGTGLESKEFEARLASAGESRFKPLIYSRDFKNMPPLQWRVKGVFPARGIAMIYGPSRSGKSFLAIDLAFAIAEGAMWFDLQTKQSAVVYVALEGEQGICNRIQAGVEQKLITDPDAVVFVCDQLDISKPEDIAQLLARVPMGAVVFIDTLSRASPGKDENSGVDMGLIIRGATELAKRCEGLVILVHHTGKNEQQGARGHSSLLGALDGSISVKRDKDARTWFSDKVKDGPDGSAYAFELQTIELGVDADGDAITSCVVRPVAKTHDRKPTGQSAKAFEILKRLSDASGRDAPQSICDAMFRASVKLIGMGEWQRACASSLSKSDTGPEAVRRAFTRARSNLLETGWIGESGSDVYCARDI